MELGKLFESKTNIEISTLIPEDDDYPVQNLVSILNQNLEYLLSINISDITIPLIMETISASDNYICYVSITNSMNTKLLTQIIAGANIGTMQLDLNLRDKFDKHLELCALSNKTDLLEIYVYPDIYPAASHDLQIHDINNLQLFIEFIDQKHNIKKIIIRSSEKIMAKLKYSEAWRYDHIAYQIIKEN